MALVLGGASLLGTIYSANKQDDATKSAVSAQDRGLDIQQAMQERGIDFMSNQAEISRRNLSPYVQSGYGAQAAINAFLGLPQGPGIEQYFRGEVGAPGIETSGFDRRVSATSTAMPLSEPAGRAAAAGNYAQLYPEEAASRTGTLPHPYSGPRENVATSSILDEASARRAAAATPQQVTQAEEFLSDPRSQYFLEQQFGTSRIAPSAYTSAPAVESIQQATIGGNVPEAVQRTPSSDYVQTNDPYGVITQRDRYSGPSLESFTANSPQFQQFSFDFDPSNIQNNPAYQFRLNQGLEALDRRLAGSGFRQSGNRMIGITDYAQGLASTEYDSAYRRKFGEAQAEYASQFDYLNALMGVANVGQASAAQQAAGHNQLGTNVANILQQGGISQMQGLGNIGSINAAGTIGQANTIRGGISDLVNIGAQTDWFGMGGGGLPDYNPGGQNFSPVGSGYGIINDYGLGY